MRKGSCRRICLLALKFISDQIVGTFSLKECCPSAKAVFQSVLRGDA